MPTDDPLDPVGPHEPPSIQHGRGSFERLRDSDALDEFLSEGEWEAQQLEETSTAPPAPVHASAQPAQRGSEPAAAARGEVGKPANADRPFPDGTEAITLFDLLDRRDAMEWREAVALARRLCAHLTEWPDDAVLDARKILIAKSGDIRVMPGPAGGDPLVVQIGRLLRALLVNKTMPPGVRLILSQATFELPIFDSVTDLARALGQVSTLDENDGIQLAYARAVSGGTVTSSQNAVELPPQAPRSIVPVPRTRRLVGRFRQRRDDALLLATAAVGAAACAALAIASWTNRNDSTTPMPTPPAVSAAAADRPTMLEGLTVEPSRPVPAVPEVSRPRGEPAPRPTAPARTLPPVAVPQVAESRPESSAPRAPQLPDATPPPVPDAEKRAIALVSAGRLAEAEIVFDALLMNNPMYDPNPTAMTPDAYTQFRASRKSMLPAITARELGRARAALDQGNAERAVVIARDLERLLARVGADAAPGLHAQAQLLLDQAVEARVAAEEHVYTSMDSGVVAPRALSRQFPLTPPTGVRADRIGVLEIVVGIQGDVVFIKLHTPLNRYHERMVVSAAKAWRYRPATKDGRPVRYRLMVAINLPESGTEH